MRLIEKTAVIVFAESVDQQARKKILQTDAQTNYRLFQAFTKRSLKAANGTGLDVIRFDETLQKGETFAERIANTTKDVFASGYGRVIVIGGDCPDLKAKDLLNANSELLSNDMVLGPDLRGGVYMIGMNRESFNPLHFERLMWQTSKLRKSFVRYARHISKSIFWLKAKADFNADKDITTYWWVSGLIRSIIEHLTEPIHYSIAQLQTAPIRMLVADFDRRGP